MLYHAGKGIISQFSFMAGGNSSCYQLLCTFYGQKFIYTHILIRMIDVSAIIAIGWTLQIQGMTSHLNTIHVHAIMMIIRFDWHL